MKQLFHRYMIRPTIYKITFKLSIGAVFCLIWDRLLNQEKLYTIWEYPCLLCGCIFLAGAWFRYLKLDGISLHHLMEGWQKKEPKKKHFTKSMADFVDEKVISFEELEPKERTVCSLISELVLGILFLIPVFLSKIL